jgi:hypothetical protein
MFYRPGGSIKSINRQYDQCYADFVGAATGWLPTHKGDTIGVNICRASIVFGNAASSLVTNTPIAPEATVLMELKMFGVDLNSAAFPADQWQNMVVATSRRAHRAGWVRLRILAINNGDGTGINMALQISRTGDVGAQT